MTAPASPIVAGLQQVLAAQHACVYGYPELGTHLSDGGQVDQVRTQADAHRLVRDAISAQLVALGQTPSAADVAYAPPVALTSDQAAQQWAAALEDRAAAAYRYLLVCAVQAGETQAAIRSQAMTGLTTAATAAVFWRRLVTPNTPTVAFPGTT